MTDSEALAREGFTDFVHLDPKRRDEKKRLTWTGVLNGRLLTVLLVAEVTSWQVELVSYGSPEAAEAVKQVFAHSTIAELVALIAKIREKGVWPE
jgi:hypothetical protein